MDFSTLKQILGGLARSQTGDLAGFPVDVAESALNLGLMGGGVAAHKLGLISADQMPQTLEGSVGSSDWWAKKTGVKGGGGYHEASRFLGGLVNPLTAAKSLGPAAAMFLGFTAKNAPMQHLPRVDKVMDAMPLVKGQNRPDPKWLLGPENRALHAETGVHIGPDGLPRWEISDRNMALKTQPSAQPDLKVFGDGPLKDVVNHPELHANYPAQSNLSLGVEIGPRHPQIGGSFFSNAKTGAPERIEVNAPNPVAANAVTSHEVQHLVQGQEGFWPGAAASPDWRVTPQENETMLFLEKALKNMPEDKKQEVLDRYFSAIDKAAKFRGLEYYKNSPGEAEANATMYRRNLTDEERRANFPLDSYTVPLDKLIFRGLAGGK